MRSTPSDRLPAATLWTFSAPALALGALGIVFTIYLPPYYASHIGLGAAGVASVFFTVRMIDIFVDPAVGIAMDHTRSRLGRYRAWLIGGAPILMVAAYLTFMAAPGTTGPAMIATLLLLYVGLSIVTLSHTAWGATLAPGYNDRSRLFGVVSAAGVIGSALLLVLPTAMHVKSSGDPRLIHAMGWMVIVVTPLSVALASLRVRETMTAAAGGPGLDPRQYWGLLGRPGVLRLVLADLSLSMGPQWMSALYLYNCESAKQFTPAQASTLLLFYIASSVVGALVMGRIGARFGKHQTLMACTTGYSLGLIVIFVLPPRQFLLTGAFMAVMGFLSIGFTVMTRAMLADVGDEVRLATGKQQIGLLYSLTSLTQKVASAVSIVLTFRLLPLVGFDPKLGAHNSPAAIQGLQLVFLTGPIVFVMLGGACFIGYRLDARAHAAIRAALDARDAEAAARDQMLAIEASALTPLSPGFTGQPSPN